METLFFLYIKKDMIYQEYPYLKSLQEVRDLLINLMDTINPDEWYAEEKFFDKDKWETLRIIGGDATIRINFPASILDIEEIEEELQEEIEQETI